MQVNMYGAAIAARKRLAEQTAQQGDQGDANQGNTAASHELLHALTLGRRVIAAVTFHEVHSTPHAQTGTQSNHQSLQNVHCTVKEFYSKISFGLKKATLHTSEIHLLKRRKLRRELIYWCTYGSNCVYCESELAEQTAQQRNQGDADEGNTAASHELLHALTFY